MLHLLRRFFQSWSSVEPSNDEVSMLRGVMTDAELGLWMRMSLADRRHSLKVLERFNLRCPDALPDEVVGVALHDVGKLQSDLGTFSRVAATLLGPRSRRFAHYHDHERIGARMLQEAGASEIALGILDGSARPEVLEAFRWADDY